MPFGAVLDHKWYMMPALKVITLELPAPITYIYRQNKNYPKHVQTQGDRFRMVCPHNNMGFRSIDETWEITLINLYLFIQNH